MRVLNCTKDPSLTARGKGSEDALRLMVMNMKGSGRTTSEMERSTTREKASENTLGLMVLHMKGSVVTIS